MKELCSADETRILDFLYRVGLLLASPPVQPADLHTLRMFKDSAHAAEYRETSPELAKLADEFYAPFTSEALPADVFDSLADAYQAMMGANELGDVQFNFRTFAHEESEYWHLDGTPLAKYMPFPIFGLYMIREGDPYRYGDFLENVFCYPRLPDDAPTNQYGQNEIEAFFDGDGGELERGNGEGWEQIDYTDPAKMDSDPRYSEAYAFGQSALDLTFTFDVMESLSRTHAFDYESDAVQVLRENLVAQATESARDYFTGNAVYPRAVLSA